MVHVHGHVFWELKTVGDDGAEMQEVDGIAMGLIDGVWRLVHQNLAGVIRVGVRAPGGQYVRVGLIITSGESKWATFEGLSAIQLLLQEIITPLSHWEGTIHKKPVLN